MSSLKVDTITDRSGNSIPYMKGAVLQVKYFQLTTSQTETYGTADNDQAITNFVVNITPKSASSIIKLEANVMYESENATWSTIWFFFRNSTKLANTQGSVGSRKIGIASAAISYYASEDASTVEMLHMGYFDAPNTTSEIAYKLGVNTTGTNNFFINRTISDTDNNGYERGVSFISATEIGG
jgi:hypothetical protein